MGCDRIALCRSASPSRAMARLTPDGVRPSASAARTKLPASTTAIITLTPESNRASNIDGDSESSLYGLGCVCIKGGHNGK